MNSLLNTLFNNKNLTIIASLALLIAGSFSNNLFIIAPAAYFLALALAYAIGGRISDEGLNIAYSWSVKWVLFVVFLYLTGLYLRDAFVYAMFAFILINITLSPMSFISQNKAIT